MTVITRILAVLMALEFFYILYLETFATTSEKTAKVFGMKREELSRKSVKPKTFNYIIRRAESNHEKENRKRDENPRIAAVSGFAVSLHIPGKQED